MVRRILLPLLFFVVQIARSAQSALDVFIRDSLRPVKMNLPPGFALSAYAGRYENPVYGWIDISTTGQNHLLMKFEHHPQLTATLESLGAQHFLCTFSDPIMGIKPLPFHTEGGKVTGFTLQVADFVEFTTYEFVKK